MHILVDCMTHYFEVPEILKCIFSLLGYLTFVEDNLRAIVQYNGIEGKEIGSRIYERSFNTMASKVRRVCVCVRVCCCAVVLWRRRWRKIDNEDDVCVVMRLCV